MKAVSEKMSAFVLIFWFKIRFVKLWQSCTNLRHKPCIARNCHHCSLCSPHTLNIICNIFILTFQSGKVKVRQSKLNTFILILTEYINNR